MRTFIVLITMMSVCMASELIPFENVKNMVDNFVAQRFDSYYFDEVLTYYGFNEMPHAYAMIYKNYQGEPLTVIAGAQWTCTPISEFSKNLPQYYSTLEKARAKARELCSSEPHFEKIYYFGHEDEYFSFKCGDQEILVNTYSMAHYEKDRLLVQPQRDAGLETMLREKWHKYLSCNDFGSRYTGYVDSVPYCFWSYGCSPTASAMVLWYWDSRGYGKLVDYFFDRWDNVEQENDYNLPNVQRELAVGMNTDSMNTGGTSSSSIVPGHLYAANTVNGYSFTSSASPTGGTWNNWAWEWIYPEIDNGRPINWSIFNYWEQNQFINHSTCGVGYDIIQPDTFVIVHTTWGTGEWSWTLWTYHNGVYSTCVVFDIIPGGSNPNNIDLTWPTVLNTWMFRGLKYEFTWTSEGSSIDHLKMWTAPGGSVPQSYDSTYWTVLENSYPNTGSYMYNVPDESLYHRVNICAVDASNARLAADGSYGSFSTKPVIASNVDLFGHNLLSGNAQDVVVVNDYAYLALGEYGIGVVDISDSSLPTVVNIVDIGGSPRSLFYDGQYLYCTTFSDSGFNVMSLTDPVNPSVIGSTILANQTFGIHVAGDIAYVAARISGLRIVSVATPSSPNEVGSYDTPGQAYDVCIIHDTIAVVADGTKDLIFLDVSNSAAPESILVFNCPGIPKGVWYDGYLFVGDGSAGVGIMDVSDPAQPESLAWFNTSGQSYSGVRSNNLLYVADGPSGLRILDISNPNSPAEIGYLDSYSNANAIALITSSKYVLADGDDGIYHMGSTVGIEEYDSRGAMSTFFTLFPNPFKDNTSIQLSSRICARVQIVVYNVLGARVKEITDQIYNPGTYEFSWDATDDLGRSVSPGVYFMEVQKENTKQTRKVVFVH